MVSPYRPWLLAGLISPWLPLVALSPTPAQVVPDATLGNEGSLVAPGVQVGGEVADLIEGGAIRGSNLFHSFLEFNIEAGQRLYFASPGGIESILSRVTGGNPSNIFGTLGVAGGADLFLLNPNGIVFGETAALDIQGSFYATTAEAIPLGDGMYSATEPVQSTLLTVNPNVLFSNYLTNASGDIENWGQLAAQENLTLAANNLDLQGQVAAGGALTLLGLDTVQIRDTAALPFVGFAGGDLLVQGNQQVDIVALSHPDSGLYSYGDMVLRSANPIGGDAYYWSGGSFWVETLDSTIGDLFSPIDPIIRTLGDVTIGTYEGSSLHILAGGSVSIGTARITAREGPELGVDFLRETITLTDGTVVEIDGNAQATLDVRAGVQPEVLGIPPTDFFSLTGRDVDFDDFSDDSVVDRVPASADITVGNVFIAAPNGQVLLTNQYQPNTDLERGSIFITDGGLDVRSIEGQGGAVYLDARDNVSLIDSSIDTSGSGTVGDVVINARETIRFDRQTRRTVAASNLIAGAEGTGGDIRITAPNVELINGAQLQARTQGNGDAGNVVINAQDRVLFDGSSPNGQFVSAAFSRVNEGATGTGGNVEINTGSLTVINGAQLQASTQGNGDAGNVVINAQDRVLFDGRDPNGQFVSAAFSRVNEGATGTGGKVEINTGSLTVSNGAQLTASTLGNGDAGNVVIVARELVRFDDGDAFSSVGAEAMGTGGNVEITANILEVLNGAQLLANTLGNGDAGNVVINAQDRVLFDGRSPDGRLPSAAFSRINEGATGTGGNVEITTGSLVVTNGARLTASTLGNGDAGNVVIVARDLVRFDDGDAFSSVGAEAMGSGGNVEITANILEVLNGAQLLANTEGTGDAGNVVINAQDRVLFDGRGPDGQFASAAFSRVDEGAIGTGGNVEITTGSLAVTNGARLIANTLGNGDAGNVVIAARELVRFDDGNALSNVGAEARGSGGNVEITANILEVLNGAQLTASTLGEGDAGNVVIVARDLVRFDDSNAFSSVGAAATGAGGNVVIIANTLEMFNGAQLLANTLGNGDAGNVVINAQARVNLQGSGSRGQPSGIFTDTQASATGRGNELRITAPILQVQDGAVLFASTRNNQPGGDVVLLLNDLAVLNGGQIVTSSLGSGTAGTIRIDATNGILVSGSDPTFAERVVQIPETALLFNSQSVLSVQSSAAGGTGNILIGEAGTTPRLELEDGGQIIAESAAVDGGSITLNLTDRLVLRNGSLISATAGTDQAGGDGGNVTITVPFIIAIPQENSDIAADAFAGAGGNVNITARGVFGLEPRPQQTSLSDITASSELGISGAVNLDVLDTGFIENSLTGLDEVNLDTDLLTANSCIVRADEEPQGSFVVTGSGGLPHRPGDAAISAYPTGTVRTLPPSTATRPLQEPDGVYQLADGRLVLSHECGEN